MMTKHCHLFRKFIEDSIFWEVKNLKFTKTGSSQERIQSANATFAQTRESLHAAPILRINSCLILRDKQKKYDIYSNLNNETMRLLMPIAMIIVFAFYILYLALVKKDLKSQMKTAIYPGLFFISVWGICYLLFLK